ncbi:carboxypeptidase-like regulatory domain-containing protein [Sphingobacterium sp. KU25419]|nr:carboxypeptidase-like regulatory domain-containing protein [Sphingobacterium sp. KU25419]
MRIFYTMILLIVTVSTYAQSTLLTGKVMDDTDNLSLPGATIKLLEGNRYTVSDQMVTLSF